MTIDEVKNWLNRAYRLHNLIKLDIKKIKELEDLATSIGGYTSAERVQNSPNLASKSERYIFDKDERIETLKSRINERERILEEVDKVINDLDDNFEIEVLSYRYLNFMSFREISEKTYAGITTCFRVHERAIKKISEKL